MITILPAGLLPSTSSQPGAYVVRAEAGGKGHGHALLLISNLVVVGNSRPAECNSVVDAATE